MENTATKGNQPKTKEIELHLKVNEELLKDKAIIDKQNNLIILKEGNTAVHFTADYDDPDIAKAKTEAEEAKIELDKQIDALNKDKESIDESLKSYKAAYDVTVKNNTQQHYNVFKKKETAYSQKVAAYKRKYALYKKQDAKHKLKKAEEERLTKAHQDTLDKIKWLWHLAPKKMDFKETDLRSDLKSGNIKNFIFGKIYEGGGMGWAEPCLENKAPTNKVPAGYLVAAKGQPKVLMTKWREFSATNDGAIINGKEKEFREAVQLHIYTQALYGQDLDIELYDTNWQNATLPPYELTPQEREKYNKEKSTPKALAQYFRREVRTHPLLDDEKAFISKIISNYGTNDNTSPSPAFLVQKTIVNVYLDEIWRYDAGNTLQMHAIIRSRPKDLMDTYANESEMITVSKVNENANQPLSSNTVIEVGEIETNAGNFRPCKYSGISVKAGDAEEQTVFDENVLAVDFNAQRTFNVVAGSDKAKQTIKVKVNDVETKDDDCIANPKHKGHVINVAPLTTIGFMPSNKQAGVTRPDAKPGSLSLKASFGIAGYSGKADNKSDKSATKIIDLDDNGLTFDATYNYTIKKADGSINWERLWGYVWLPSVQVDTYSITTQTCRWNHNIDFKVFPDIKWTVGFKIDFDGSKFKAFEQKFKQTSNRTSLNPFKRAYQYTQEMNSRFSRGDYSRENLDAYRRSSNRLNARLDNDGIRRVNPGAAQPSSAFDKVLKVLDNYEVSLKAEWNNGADKIDVIDTIFKTIEDFILGFKTAIKFCKAVFNGECTAKVNMNEEKRRKLVEKFTKSPVDYSLTNPSMAIAASWYYETMPPVDKSTTVWGAGITWAIQIKMDPLIGIQIKMDLFQMLSRKHPVAMAVYAASALLQTLLDQDKPIIAIDLVIKGEIAIEGNFKNNSVGGNVISRGGKSATKEELLKGSATVSVSLEVRLHGELKVDFFYVTTIKGYIDAGIKGTAGFGIETAIGSDDMGMYWENVLKFDGMKLKGNFTVDVEVTKTKEKTKKKPQPLFDGNFEIGLDEASLPLGKCRF